MLRKYIFISDENGVTHNSVMLVFLAFFAVFLIFKFIGSHANAYSPYITSGISGHCLDIHEDQAVKNGKVDAWSCNNTNAQAMVVNGLNITHKGNMCLSVENNLVKAGSPIVIDPCSDAAGQVWLSERGGYFNPNSSMCLTASVSNPSSQLTIQPCNDLTFASQTWTPTNLGSSGNQIGVCNGTRSQKISCNAAKEWTSWQSGSVPHETLLTSYTDGEPYEQWCADFVSYVYKESGYPFTQGEADGWDENNANNVQNMGFTLHMASTGYVPKTGDVAYFDYNQGHVEIVVSGGKNPTFIYGDSATVDPTTGNGQMMANTILNDGSEGGVVYYLSPN